MRNKSVSTTTSLEQEFIPKSVQELQEYGGFSSEQETVDFVNRSLAQIRRTKQRKAAVLSVSA